MIPSKVKAKVSIRIVPDQKLEDIVRSLKDYVEQSFEELRSPNALKVSIDNATDWWLGDIQGPWFRALETAIKEEWLLEPLRIREGGVSCDVMNILSHACVLPMEIVYSFCSVS